MDFFQRQDVARRNTFRLVCLFTVGIVALVIAMNVTVLVLFSAFRAFSAARDIRAVQSVERPPPPRPVDGNPIQIACNYPQVLLITSLATLGMIVVGSLYKFISLSAGGPAVAAMLGGVPLARGSGRREYEQLLDIVEEMAIASGCRVPQVFVLEDERAINAFAAGRAQEDSVIGVTAGALTLNRDQLQGVIAHEFSHILNRDTHLNLKLISLLHGILAISVVGYMLLRGVIEMRIRPRSGKGAGGAVALIVFILILGASMIVIGSIGLLFGRMIQAAVSRQREYLADSSAVQFTRNPRGLASALQTLMHNSGGRKLACPEGAEVAHMMFSSIQSWSLGALTATHPPLPDRIEAIAPGFLAEVGMSGVQRRQQPPPLYPASAHPAGISALAGGQRVSAARLLPQDYSPKRVARAGLLLESIPPELREAAGQPFSAQAVVLAVLFGAHSPEQRRQAAEASRHHLDSGLLAEVRRLLPPVESLGAGARMPLVDLALPALRSLSPTQARNLRKLLSCAIAADNEISLFEYCLSTVVTRVLERVEGIRGGTPSGGVASMSAVESQVHAVLSMVARLDGRQGEPALGAYIVGMRRIGLIASPHGPDDVSVILLDNALATLASCNPGIRRRVLEAAAAAMAVDGLVSTDEAELVRALGATLDVPIPPLLDLDVD
jgi:Zn-dependent protease with chaperone function